jgi:hypothetical protein
MASFSSLDDDDKINVCHEAMGEAITKMQSLMSDDFNAAFNKRRRKMVEVKPSSIPGAGLGLFAKERIKAGTIVAFYPAHILGMEKDESICRVSLNDATGLPDMLDEEDDDDNTDQAYLHHLLGSRPLMNTGVDLFGGLFVDVDMEKTDVPGWVGHRVNDGAVVTENSEEGVLTYYRSSRAAKNCILVPFGPSPVLAAVATRKTQKGEELFTSYGCSYWLDSLLKNMGGDQEETEMTDSILEEAKAVAKDVFLGMQSVAVTNVNDAKVLQSVFDS